MCIRDSTMVGLDVTHRVVLTRRDIAGWTGSGTMAGCAFAGMVEHYIGSYEMNAPYPVSYTHLCCSS